MKIQLRGELSVPLLRQGLFEQLNIMQNRFSVRYVRGTTLYLTPTNGFGDPVTCYDDVGREISSLYAPGPYPCAADRYDIFELN